MHGIEKISSNNILGEMKMSSKTQNITLSRIKDDMDMCMQFLSILQ